MKLVKLWIIVLSSHSVPLETILVSICLQGEQFTMDRQRFPELDRQCNAVKVAALEVYAAVADVIACFFYFLPDFFVLYYLKRYRV